MTVHFHTAALSVTWCLISRKPIPVLDGSLYLRRLELQDSFQKLKFISEMFLLKHFIQYAERAVDAISCVTDTFACLYIVGVLLSWYTH
jgi:hypothetical protein